MGKPVSDDHFPPKQFVAARILAENPGMQLSTHCVHHQCNQDYKKDEEYLVHTFMPFIPGTYSGRALYDQTLESFRKGHNVGLVRKVLGEFEKNPSGLILPEGKTAKRFDTARTDRAVWKIIRGLYFKHFEAPLPSEYAVYVDYTIGDKTPPVHFELFKELDGTDPWGIYPGVFDYRFKELLPSDESIEHTHYWAMLIWDALLVIVYFHDVNCPCSDCTLLGLDTPTP